MAENKKPISKKQQACVNRYMASHYDRINLTVPKGNRDALKVITDSLGESVNVFVNVAIEQRISRECPGAEYAFKHVKPAEEDNSNK